MTMPKTAQLEPPACPEPGTSGAAGTNGLNCWDLNQNGVADLATEDTDQNSTVDVTTPPEAHTIPPACTRAISPRTSIRVRRSA
ncbi:MAG: hypothetical protein IPJ97_00575 [Proteobacteria bacterium]|nr:hypothetical protein [Pseudomonadota bacterium]